MYNEVLIPDAVFNEVSKKDYSYGNYPFLKKTTIENIKMKKMFKSALHDGEVEVIILAGEIGADLCIIDDFLARKYAVYAGLTVTGTLGVLLKAKQNGILTSIKPLINDLVHNGIYISERIADEVLKLAGE